MFVKPAEDGAVVRFPPPSRRVLAADGEDVPDFDRWWLRRLAHKDIVKCKPPAAAAEAPPVSQSAAAEPAPLPAPAAAKLAAAPVAPVSPPAPSGAPASPPPPAPPQG